MKYDAHAVRVAIALSITCFFCGTDFIVTKLLMATLPPFLYAGMRWMICGLLVFVYLYRRGVPLPTARQARNALLVAVFLIVGGNGIRVLGQTMAAAGITSVVMATGPILLMLLAILCKMERLPHWRIWLYMIGGVAGIILIILPRAEQGSSNTSLAGVLVVLAACLCWAVGALLSRHASSHPNRMMAASLHMLLASPVLLLISWLSGEWKAFDFYLLPWTTYAWFAYMVISLSSYTSLVWLLGHTSAEVATSYAYVSPVIALALSCLFLGERLTLPGFAGCILVLTMVSLLMRSKFRRQA